MRTARLFIVTAAIEAATGLALVVAPAAVVARLVGAGVDTAGGMVIARVAGIAMFSIAVACWLARDDHGGEASRGLLLALLVYNSAVMLLLINAAVFDHLSAIGLWPAAVLHAGLAAWCAISRAR